jgi:hypothetical protein
MPKKTVAELSEILNLQDEIIRDLSEKVAALTESASPKPASKPRRPHYEVLRSAPEEMKERSRKLYESLKALSDVYTTCEHVRTAPLEPDEEHPHWGYVVYNGPQNGQGRTTYKFGDWDRVLDWLEKKVAAAEAARRRSDPSRATLGEIVAAHAVEQ